MGNPDDNFVSWFVGLSPDDPVWDPTTFTKNRDRLQNGRRVHEVHDQASEPSSGQTTIVHRKMLVRQ